MEKMGSHFSAQNKKPFHKNMAAIESPQTNDFIADG
jgi:hypothetical protein